MKLFYTKRQFQGMVEKYQKEIKCFEDKNKELSNEWFDLQNKINKLEDKCSKLQKTNKYHQELIAVRDKGIEQISKKYREVAGAKGGFIARINSLVEELDEAKVKLNKYEEEIADLKSDRYLRVKPATKNRKPNQKMQLYSKRRTSDIIKNVKEKL